MRTGRTNGSVTYTYLYNGSQLTQMTRGSVVMRFSYGTDGRPLVISYNDTPYYYITNLQGDVVAIVNSSGTTVVSYVYDVWGRLISTDDDTDIDLGEINPLRYRGYIYDQETGLYYLQSRYYNPAWGRFINADVYTSTGQGMLGNNMFAYCLNNPARYCDTEGESATIAGAIVGGIFGAINGLMSGGSLSEILACAAIGAITGAAAGFVADVSVATCGVGTAILYSAIAGGTMGSINSASTQFILNDGNIDPAKVIYDGVLGAMAGGMSTAMVDIVKPVAVGLREGINHVNALVSTECIMLSAGKVTSNFMFDVGCSSVTGFGSWMFGIVCDYYNLN